MGFFDFLKNVNKAEGSRMLTRRTYNAYFDKAKRGEFHTNDSPHYMGLYGALGNWKNANRQSVNEMQMWVELAPFLVMNEEDSVEALAEYIVFMDRHKYDEYPRIDMLTSKLNNALKYSTGEIRELAIVGVSNRFDWCNLIDEDIKLQLQNEAQE